MFVCSCTEIKSTEPSFPHIQQDGCKYWCCIYREAIWLMSCCCCFTGASINRDKHRPRRFLPLAGPVASRRLQCSSQPAGTAALLEHRLRVGCHFVRRVSAEGSVWKQSHCFCSVSPPPRKRNILTQFWVRFNLNINIIVR